MKTLSQTRKSLTLLSSLLLVASVFAATGCANTPLIGSNNDSSKDLASTGPTVLNARTEPGTIELNRKLQPITNAQILADVKDFRSDVKAVKLQFTHVPLEIQMHNIGGSTWLADLTPQQLRMLAVSGKTITYEANIVAQNDNGQTAVSEKPVEVAVKAPDLANSSG